MATHDDAPTRRGMLQKLATACAVLPCAAGTIALLRAGLVPAPVSRPARLPLCRLRDVPATGVLARAIGFDVRRGAVVETVAKIVFVRRDPGDGSIVALSGTCPHLGCPVVLREDAQAPLHCPCHDGAFAADGTVVSGPAERALERLAIEVPQDPDDMIVLLDP